MLRRSPIEALECASLSLPSLVSSTLLLHAPWGCLAKKDIFCSFLEIAHSFFFLRDATQLTISHPLFSLAISFSMQCLSSCLCYFFFFCITVLLVSRLLSVYVLYVQEACLYVWSQGRVPAFLLSLFFEKRRKKTQRCCRSYRYPSTTPSSFRSQFSLLSVRFFVCSEWMWWDERKKEGEGGPP